LNRTLTPEESSRLIAYATSQVPAEEIHSLCAYGPEVAGYETDGPPIGLVIITKNQVKVVPGGPGTSPQEIPYLTMTEKGLLASLDVAPPGDPVLSKFLNIYEPLVNPGFLRQVEVGYKKRIIAEALFELQSSYDDLSSSFTIPYEYFLFDQLHKSVLASPDELEMYVRTYSGPRKGENIAFALDGLREAAGSLASTGTIRIAVGSVGMLRGREQRLEAMAKLRRSFPHSPKVLVEKAMLPSPVKMGIEPSSRPLPSSSAEERAWTMFGIDRPRGLLQLDEGIVFDDAERMIEELARAYGFSGVFEHEEKKMGDFTNSTKMLELKGDGRQAKFILKPFPELNSAKWFILNLWSIFAKRFNMTPLSRLGRELEGARRLREIGIGTHRIAGVVLSGKTLVTEFEEGVPLDRYVQDIAEGKGTDTRHIEDYARALAKMHRAGLVYGDTKPANALVGKDGLYLLDLEQAEEGGDTAWDLAEFLYFSARTAEKEERMRLIADAFLSAYRSENGSQTIARARRIRYLNPFFIFVRGKMLRAVRRSLEAHSSPDEVV
jgi:tRNA A-37 threonylcarbamoyl transferase component Bud32